MSFETYKQIMNDINFCINPGKSKSFSFDGSGCENAGRLFITGETNISPYWKTEPDYQMLYRRIDDSLVSSHDGSDRFALDLSGGRRHYPLVAYRKLVTPFQTPMHILNDCTNRWKFGISVKADKLRIYGYLKVTVEVRYLNGNTSRHSTVDEPDQIFTIDVPEGKYGWNILSKEIEIDLPHVANVCYFVEGEDFEGKVLFEAPHFTSESGHNLVGQFIPHTEDRQGVNWLGQNLSHIEWIGMQIDINGKRIFDGEIFERCHRFSENEIIIPEGLVRSGENEITFTCTSDYRDAAGFDLREFGFITDKRSRIIACPEVVFAGKPFYVLAEGKAGEKLSFRSKKISPITDTVLKKDGLSAIGFITDEVCCNLKMQLCGEELTILRSVLREDDGILTGTGDMIYIPNKKASVENFLKWYLSENIGNLLTVRPTYRWNGTRIYDSDVWQSVAELLSDMGIHYSHMLDGRELPGCDANPTKNDLDGKYFLGRQTHEFDGQYVYWGKIDITQKPSEEMFFDLFLRMYRRHPERMNLQYIPENIRFTDTQRCIFRAPTQPTDMKEAAEEFVRSLVATRKGNLRHTGPATLFKYFYEAGYKWLGAELMYTPTELTVSALRGANRVYGGKMGAHHAVQWSTSPHDTESRYKRYRLALFISYIQGIDEINTEEGLWRLEEYYNYHHRFTTACKNHTLVQKDFFKFIQTHTRRGKHYTPIAFLSGRYDGWRCFGRSENTWGISEFGFTNIERSWDILTYFYPKSVLDALYRHNCPDEEIGYYSGTPSGCVDILPIEASELPGYRLLILSGYNKALSEDKAKLDDFVTRGGTLLFGWPQLSVTTDRQRAVTLDHEYLDGKEPNFISDTYLSHPVSVCDDIDCDGVILYTDNGRPLVTFKHIGNGTVYFVNAKEYAGADGVMLAYRKTLDLLVPSILKKETVYAEGDRNIQFTVFERSSDLRDIYFIATDWHKPTGDGVGKLRIGSDIYSIPVRFGETVKVTASSKAAIYPKKDENEVISLNDTEAFVQGVGIAEFVILKNGESRSVTVDFTKNATATINI